MTLTDDTKHRIMNEIWAIVCKDMGITESPELYERLEIRELDIPKYDDNLRVLADERYIKLSRHSSGFIISIQPKGFKYILREKVETKHRIFREVKRLEPLRKAEVKMLVMQDLIDELPNISVNEMYGLLNVLVYEELIEITRRNPIGMTWIKTTSKGRLSSN